MNLKSIVETAADKDRFRTIESYSDFCLRYLEFVKTGLQAVIVSLNENNYRFFQYKEDGNYNVMRPINSSLMLSLESFDSNVKRFFSITKNIRDGSFDTKSDRKLFTLKLNPLNGVYYFDIRPRMSTDAMLQTHIKTFDHFLLEDVWKFLE